MTGISALVTERAEVSTIQINTNCSSWDCGIDLEDSEALQQNGGLVSPSGEKVDLHSNVVI